MFFNNTQRNSTQKVTMLVSYLLAYRLDYNTTAKKGFFVDSSFPVRWLVFCLNPRLDRPITVAFLEERYVLYHSILVGLSTILNPERYLDIALPTLPLRRQRLLDEVDILDIPIHALRPNYSKQQ